MIRSTRLRPTLTPRRRSSNSRRAVGGGELVLTADLVDQREQLGVLARPLRRSRPSGAPVVVSRSRDAQDPQYEIDREVMRVNETHDRLRVGSISPAKYALAARSTSNVILGRFGRLAA
jgi:hypothetical protein